MSPTNPFYKTQLRSDRKTIKQPFSLNVYVRIWASKWKQMSDKSRTNITDSTNKLGHCDPYQSLKKYSRRSGEGHVWFTRWLKYVSLYPSLYSKSLMGEMKTKNGVVHAVSQSLSLEDESFFFFIGLLDLSFALSLDLGLSLLFLFFCLSASLSESLLPLLLFSFLFLPLCRSSRSRLLCLWEDRSLELLSRPLLSLLFDSSALFLLFLSSASLPRSRLSRSLLLDRRDDLLSRLLLWRLSRPLSRDWPRLSRPLDRDLRDPSRPFSLLLDRSRRCSPFFFFSTSFDFSFSLPSECCLLLSLLLSFCSPSLSRSLASFSFLSLLLERPRLSSALLCFSFSLFSLLLLRLRAFFFSASASVFFCASLSLLLERCLSLFLSLPLEGLRDLFRFASLFSRSEFFFASCPAALFSLAGWVASVFSSDISPLNKNTHERFIFQVRIINNIYIYIYIFE